MRARSVTDVILGEAVSGSIEKRYEDMKAIASVMVNRARSLGVPLETVVQNQREFNAYNKPLPSGVNAYRNLAQQAIDDVLTNGPVHNATFYATPAAKGNLPKGLVEEARTGGHVYYSDPKNRAIGTSIGYRQPDALAATQYAGIDERNIPVPSASPRGLLSASFPATPSPVERGGILSAPVQQVGFDEGRFGPRTQPVEGFDEGRLGRSTAMNYQNLVDANRATRPQTAAASPFDSGRFGTITAQPQGMDGLRQGLLASNAQMANPQGILNTAAAAQPALEIAKTGRLPAAPQLGPAPFQGPVAPGMQPAMDAANLQLDVMDQRAKMGLPAVNQPVAQPGYVDPVVSAQPAAPAQPAQAAQPAMGGGVLASPNASNLGPAMTLEEANKISRDLGMRRMGGGLLGGILGGALLGPIGALAGGYIGRQMGAKSYYPPAPKTAGKPQQQQRLSRDNLSDKGRDLYDSSKQVRDAVDKGSSGLW